MNEQRGSESGDLGAESREELCDSLILRVRLRRGDEVNHVVLY